jgi:uncharacterized Zn finger protein
MDCSCPDWAGMCKHVAAALYGVGARLDHQPELLFTLRQVDHLELITEAGTATAAAGKRSDKGGRRIAANDLAEVFGVDMEPASPAPAPATQLTPAPVRRPTATAANAAATPARRRGTKGGAKPSSHGRGPEKKAGKSVGRPKSATHRSARRNPA